MAIIMPPQRIAAMPDAELLLRIFATRCCFYAPYDITPSAFHARHYRATPFTPIRLSLMLLSDYLLLRITPLLPSRRCFDIAPVFSPPPRYFAAASATRHYAITHDIEGHYDATPLRCRCCHFDYAPDVIADAATPATLAAYAATISDAFSMRAVYAATIFDAIRHCRLPLY